jgi:hypothetical protein
MTTNPFEQQGKSDAGPYEVRATHGQEGRGQTDDAREQQRARDTHERVADEEQCACERHEPEAPADSAGFFGDLNAREAHMAGHECPEVVHDVLHEREDVVVFVV